MGEEARREEILDVNNYGGRKAVTGPVGRKAEEGQRRLSGEGATKGMEMKSPENMEQNWEKGTPH